MVQYDCRLKKGNLDATSRLLVVRRGIEDSDRPTEKMARSRA